MILSTEWKYFNIKNGIKIAFEEDGQNRPFGIIIMINACSDILLHEILSQ